MLRDSNFGYGVQRNKRVLDSSCGRYIYHVCIIDYIQSFNYVKKGEIILKTVLLNAKQQELSAMRPDKYAERFVKFMRDTVFQRQNDILSSETKFLNLDEQTKTLIETNNRHYSQVNYYGSKFSNGLVTNI